MDNATPLEVLWTTLFAIGGAFGAVLFGYFISKLIRRYRQARNGGGRLLAWREVLVVGPLTTAMGLGATLGVVAMVAPSRIEQAEGEVERWAVTVLTWSSALSLIGMGICIVATLATMLGFEILIARYFLTHTAISSDFDDAKALGMADEPDALRVNTEAVQANTEAVEANTAAQSDKEG